MFTLLHKICGSGKNTGLSESQIEFDFVAAQLAGQTRSFEKKYCVASFVGTYQMQIFHVRYFMHVSFWEKNASGMT